MRQADIDMHPTTLNRERILKCDGVGRKFLRASRGMLDRSDYKKMFPFVRRTRVPL